LTEDENLIG